MIDAVITWVDGNDLGHREKRLKYQGLDSGIGTKSSSNDFTRFADNNEVRFGIQSIRKYAPYIDNIYLVTDDQQPDFCSKEFKQKFKIKVVDHKEIFADYLRFLPTFNSSAIECMLHRIAGLSDNFLYFNDDFIFIRPTKKEDYFDRGSLVYRGEWFWKIGLKKRLFWLKRMLNRAGALDLPGRGFVGYRNEGTYFKRSRHGLLCLAHAPYPLNKRLCEEVFKDKILLEEQLQYRFRNKKQFRFVSLAANLAVNKGLARLGPKDHGYISCLRGLDLMEVEAWVEQMKARDKLKSVCIQSLDQVDPAAERIIKEFLNERVS